MDIAAKISIAVLLVNSIAALAAVAAAIIAVCGNKSTQKQLENSMDLQNRAINAIMYDKRMGIKKYFEQDYKSTAAVIERILSGKDRMVESFRMLFSRPLISEYDAMLAFEQEKNELQNRKDEFLFKIKHREGARLDEINDAMDMLRDLEEAEKAARENDAPNATQDFEALADTISLNRGEDYFTLCNEIWQKEAQYKGMRDEFLLHMQNEIRQSVKYEEEKQGEV